MSMSIRTNDRRLRACVARIAGPVSVRVGILTGKGAEARQQSQNEGMEGQSLTLGQIAAIHEFGCTIPVTDKMRGWFFYQGHPLSQQTTEIVIPQRSWCRACVDEHQADIEKLQRAVVRNMWAGKINRKQAGDQIGARVAGMMQQRIAAGIEPGLSQFTIDRKGSSKPLIGKQAQLRSSITWLTEAT